MSPQVMGMVLLAALAHATWNVAAKRAAGGKEFALTCSLISLVLYAGPLGWVVAHGGLPGTWQAVAAIFASGVLHMAYFSVLQTGYRVSELSVVYPVARGSGPLLSITLSIVALGERPGTCALLGGAIVIAGVFWLASGPALFPSHGSRARQGVLWGVATGVFIASYTVLDGYAVRTLAVAPLVLDYGSHVVRVFSTGAMVLSDRPRFYVEARRTFKHALVVSTLGPLGYLLVLHAMRMAPISLVAPAREVSMLFAAFFGARVLAEGDLPRRLACAALIALGTGLIALG